MKLSDVTVAVTAIMSMLIDGAIKAFAEVPSIMYVASGVCLYKTLVPPMCRSIIAGVVPKKEIGKVFSITSSLEALLSAVSSPIYAFVYNKTFTTFAGAYFLITSGASFVSLLLVLAVARMLNKRESFMGSNRQIGS
jgi:MFS transporter, PCFT/HCP family, solute carrier family 46 (folate transporter), member 1